MYVVLSVSILLGLGLIGFCAAGSKPLLQTTGPNIGAVRRVGDGVLVGNAVLDRGAVFVGNGMLVGNAVKGKLGGIGVGVTFGNSAINVLATRVARAETVVVPATSVAIASGVGAGCSKSHAGNSMNTVKQFINRGNVRRLMQCSFRGQDIFAGKGSVCSSELFFLVRKHKAPAATRKRVKRQMPPHSKHYSNCPALRHRASPLKPPDVRRE